MSKDLPLSRNIAKLPAVGALFWVIKIVTTGMGEAASDFLVRTLGNYLAVGLGGLVFAAFLIAQFRANRYSKWLYWITVAMVSVFGTMAADVVHMGFGVPYATSTIAFAIALVAAFVAWWRFEGTVSLTSITSKRREVFYWITVLVTFALGTAAGDMTARTWNLGYLASGFWFAVAFAIPLVLFALKARYSVLWFWFAYVATRPFGASFADWIGAEPARQGLGFGFGNIALVLALAFTVLVATAPKTNKPTK